jgi:hypothetical protein
MRTRNQLFSFTDPIPSQKRRPSACSCEDLAAQEKELRRLEAQGALPAGAKIVTVKVDDVLVDVGVDLTACLRSAMAAMLVMKPR